MASKSRQRPRTAVARTIPRRQSSRRSPFMFLGGAAVIAIVALVAIVALSAASSPTATRDISVADLRTELQHKDFTLLNVKTPYIGEIDGTDLYIPYDQLESRANELPADKNAKIVVYCRTGNESTIASHTLESLGYKHIENVSGGMTAWTAAGGSLVQKNR